MRSKRSRLYIESKSFLIQRDHLKIRVWSVLYLAFVADRPETKKNWDSSRLREIAIDRSYHWLKDLPRYAEEANSISQSPALLLVRPLSLHFFRHLYLVRFACWDDALNIHSLPWEPRLIEARLVCGDLKWGRLFLGRPLTRSSDRTEVRGAATDNWVQHDP